MPFWGFLKRWCCAQKVGIQALFVILGRWQWFCSEALLQSWNESFQLANSKPSESRDTHSDLARVRGIAQAWSRARFLWACHMRQASSLWHWKPASVCTVLWKAWVAFVRHFEAQLTADYSSRQGFVCFGSMIGEVEVHLQCLPVDWHIQIRFYEGNQCLTNNNVIWTGVVVQLLVPLLHHATLSYKCNDAFDCWIIHYHVCLLTRFSVFTLCFNALAWKLNVLSGVRTKLHLWIQIYIKIETVLRSLLTLALLQDCMRRISSLICCPTSPCPPLPTARRAILTANLKLECFE